MKNYLFSTLLLLFISSYSQNKPTLSDKNSFSMILLPDPQSYTKFDTNQPIFELMTAWVASVKKLSCQSCTLHRRFGRTK